MAVGAILANPTTLLTILQLARMATDLATRAVGGEVTEEEMYQEMVDMLDHLALANSRFEKAAEEFRKEQED